MSISKQKIICFIPIINFVVTLFCWIKMYFENVTKMSRFLKVLFRMFLIAIITTIPRIIIDRVIGVESISVIAMWVFGYIALFGISYVAVLDQEKMIKGKEKDSRH